MASAIYDRTVAGGETDPACCALAVCPGHTLLVTAGVAATIVFTGCGAQFVADLTRFGTFAAIPKQIVRAHIDRRGIACGIRPSE